MSMSTWLPAVPFCSLLLALLVGPSISPRLWHHPLTRLGILLVLCSPAALRDALEAPGRLVHVVDEYASFFLLLWALYQLASGIMLEGPFSGTPKSNLCLLILGSLAASAIGTTGASMLFLPVLLRANEGRAFTNHLIVSFIFLVSNIGGLLLPLGDPPLFLGFLHGVPFFWTLQLWPAWLINLALLLAIAYLLDVQAFRRESPAFRQACVMRANGAWKVTGGLQFLGFIGVAFVLVVCASYNLSSHVQQGALLMIAMASFVATPDEVRVFNQFSWEPLIEVAVLFLPLFLAMPQALRVIEAAAPTLPLHSNEAFFWWTGGLSSILDNAPCYLTFATLANAKHGFSGVNLTALAHDTEGASTLMAIAHGAVGLGAGTYIGNGPNVMVRARAIEAGFSAPSFFGYVAWAVTILLPVFLLSRWILGFV